jgi:hypothetical protein
MPDFPVLGEDARLRKQHIVNKRDNKKKAG